MTGTGAGNVSAPARQREWIYGRALLRRWLAHYAQVAAPRIEICIGAFGVDVESQQVPEYALTLSGADGTLALTGWHWSLPHWQAELALMQHGAGHVVRWFEHD